MGVKFRPKYTQQTNLNISLTIRTFAILRVCEIYFHSSVQSGMSKDFWNRCGTD